ncbi:VOC family protein [Arthrobacter sp. 260]|uniref:VOC family protein n=1 Tax=Arthrobacter sp. 260 TaxID=2735314 RepID=UPI001E2B8F20|nr:VOC family protein [Arthrobacter sp. 260]
MPQDAILVVDGRTLGAVRRLRAAAAPATIKGIQQPSRAEYSVELGAFSVSLAVKDIQASATFYESLGFTKHGGDIAQNRLILKNGETVLGLFQGMFERNSLTFNPGWDQNAGPLETFTDVRDLQRQLRASGADFLAEADEETTGPASFVVVDPDGNPVIVDQHV